MPTDDPIGSPIAPGGSTAVYESVQRFALKGLSDLIRVLMENMDDALFDLSEKAETDRERNMYFEAMREIRLKRGFLQQGFDQAMEDYFNQFSHNQATNELEEDPEELTLVELEDLEDTIAIDNMISKARPHFEDDLFAVTERLKVVLSRGEIDEDLNPLDPKAICDSFHEASDVIESQIEIKLIFYKLFDKYVMNSLGGFYRELNTLFIDKGVLPEFKASEERMKQTTRFMANRIRGSANDRAPDTPSGEPPALETDSPAHASLPIDGGDLLSMLRQVLTPALGNQAASGSAIVGENTVRQPEGRVASAEGEIAAVPVAQNAAYMTALTNLQTTSLQSQPLESINPQEARAQTHQQLLAFNRVNADQASPAENQIIDIVSMLFDFFFDDDALPAPIKVLIGRLQIPILKVAILDDSFFNHKKHPARELLDSISKASLGWGEDPNQEKVLVDKIEEVVNFLLTEFEQDVKVFDKALADFKQFLAEESERNRIADELVKKQEQERERLVKEAQDSASNLIRKLTAKRELYFEVTQFLDSTWNPVLFHIFLTMGESSNHWKNIRRISSTFIWTLVPKFSKEERVKILKTLPSLLRALSMGMDLIKIDTEAQNRIFQMLAKQHSKIVKQTSKNIVTRIDDRTVWPEGGAAEALAGFTQGLANEDIDIEFGPDATGAIQIVEKQDDPDAITIISETSTDEVIKNLDDFSSGVKKGEIKIDEEIIIDSAEQATFKAAASQDTDEFLDQAQALETGTWVKFSEDNNKALNARLAWKSKITGKYVFVNRLGQKVKQLTVYGFATDLRSGRAKLIESVSVFDRAINTIISKLTNKNQVPSKGES
ncbi:MAG: DUF1631 domain-containing protein [Gammaproteobacteria bacterium]